MGLSRPALADKLGISTSKVERTEAMDEVPVEYRLACSGLSHFPTWNWGGAPKER